MKTEQKGYGSRFSKDKLKRFGKRLFGIAWKVLAGFCVPLLLLILILWIGPLTPKEGNAVLYGWGLDSLNHVFEYVIFPYSFKINVLETTGYVFSDTYADKFPVFGPFLFAVQVPVDDSYRVYTVAGRYFREYGTDGGYPSGYQYLLSTSPGAGERHRIKTGVGHGDLLMDSYILDVPYNCRDTPSMINGSIVTVKSCYGPVESLPYYMIRFTAKELSKERVSNVLTSLNIQYHEQDSVFSVNTSVIHPFDLILKIDPENLVSAEIYVAHMRIRDEGGGTHGLQKWLEIL